MSSAISGICQLENTLAGGRVFVICRKAGIIQQLAISVCSVLASASFSLPFLKSIMAHSNKKTG